MAEVTRERWAQVTQLFEAALQRDPAHRTAFVEQACAGDVALRREVESLLKSDERAGSFMNAPAFLLGAELLKGAPGQSACKVDLASSESSPSELDQEPLARGASVGRYIVLERLGYGGMGVVYLAYDPELERKVAIKLLRPQAASEREAAEGRARLIREAKAMAMLSHPNVVAVHDVGTLNDQVFVAMEYVEGETLTQWLAHRARSWREVLSMLVQAGRGLAAAHTAGLVHRDFKPANVLVGKEGRARVADFGLARAVDSTTSAQKGVDSDRARAVSITFVAPLTRPGRFLGTPTYMAPEQLFGSGADAGTDQFSFCVVVYEALYGELPFAGDTLDALADEVKQGRIRAAPQSARIPQRLRKDLLRGLRSNAAQRFSSMAELLDQLQLDAAPIRRRWAAVGVLVCLSAIVALTTRPWKRSVRSQQIQALAVLPFRNLAGDPSLDPILEQLNESLTNSLGQVTNRIQIISRDSAMKYSRVSQSVPAIAKELDADAVIAGSVATSRPRLRLDVQLLDASERQLWARSYEGDYEHIPTLLADLATDLVMELEAKLTLPQQASLSKVRSTKSEVYEAYVKGQHFLNTRNESSIRLALKYFEEALRQDPEYAPAHAGLAEAYMFLAVPGSVLSPREASRLGTAAALKALSLDPELAEAHVALGFIRFQLDWDWRGAEQELKRAIELNPNHANAHRWYSGYLLDVGRADEALFEGRRAQRLNPLTPQMLLSTGYWQLAMGHYDEAIREFQKGVELNPYDGPMHAHLSNAYDAAGRYQEAFEEIRKAYELSSNPWQRAGMAHELAHLNRTSEADDILDTIKDQVTQTAASFTVASTYAVLRRREETLRWLQYAFDARANYMLKLKRDPDFEWLRSDVRFQELVSRIEWPG